MEGKIVFRALVEILGKPKEHVEKTIKDYVNKLKTSEEYNVLNEKFAEIKKQEEQDLWATFAELEIETTKVENLVAFCFEYMPSLIEIIEPNELNFKDIEVSHFLNDLQARLHQVDMVAKQVNLENQHLKTNMTGLMKNYVTILLSKENMDGNQLSQLTGVTKDKLEDFLDQLIDEGKIDLKEGIYFLKEKKEKMV